MCCGGGALLFIFLCPLEAPRSSPGSKIPFERKKLPKTKTIGFIIHFFILGYCLTFVALYWLNFPGPLKQYKY